MSGDEDYMEDFFEVFESMERQGPGSPASTLRAFRALPEGEAIGNIMDIGCGKGAASLTLAEACDAHIVAVDNHQPFLDHLATVASRRGLGERIETRNASMFELADPDGSFDLLWAEGSAYIMGFERALEQWRRLLCPGGHLFVSEAVLLAAHPSPEVSEYWRGEYPDIQDVETRKNQAAKLGYRVVDSFILPRSDWRAFYDDMDARIDAVIASRGMTRAFEEMKKEIALDRSFGDEYGYVCLLLQKT